MRGRKTDLSSGSKECPKCQTVKELSEFGPNKYAASGFSSYCRACMAEEARARRATPEGKKRHYESTLRWAVKPGEAPTEKVCPKCHVIKPLSLYPKNKYGKHGIAAYCLSCAAEIVRQRRATPEGQATHRAASKRWREANKERHADNNAKRNYGVEHGTYAQMLAEQDGKCAICGTDKPGSGADRFAIDHCHSSKNVRGLLCHHCNRGLGYFRDSPSTLVRAINYLSKCAVER